MDGEYTNYISLYIFCILPQAFRQRDILDEYKNFDFMI